MDKTSVIRNLEKGRIIVSGSNVYLQIGNDVFIVPLKQYYEPTEEAMNLLRRVVRVAQVYYDDVYDQILFMQNWPAFFGVVSNDEAVQKLKTLIDSIIESGAQTIIYLAHATGGKERTMRYYSVTRSGNKYFVSKSPYIEKVTENGIEYTMADD